MQYNTLEGVVLQCLIVIQASEDKPSLCRVPLNRVCVCACMYSCFATAFLGFRISQACNLVLVYIALTSVAMEMGDLQTQLMFIHVYVRHACVGVFDPHDVTASLQATTQ